MRAELVVRSGGEIDDWLEEAPGGRRLRRTGRDARRAHEHGAALVAGPARRAASGPAAARRADPGRSGRQGGIHGQRRALPRASCGARPHDRALYRHDPGGDAQARHDARLARRVRAPLRPRRDRDGDPLALDARPGLGRRDGRARTDDPARARARGLRGELGPLRRRARDRARGRRPRRPRRYGRTRSARRARPARPTSARWRPTRARSRRPSAATSRAVRKPAFEPLAPYMQRALVEILLLAVLAGALGAWIVLRRLAFFTHSVGTATFPGLVVARRGGSRRSWRRSAPRSASRALRERLARGRVADEDAATGILSSPRSRSARCSPPTSTAPAPASTGSCSAP